MARDKLKGIGQTTIIRNKINSHKCCAISISCKLPIFIGFSFQAFSGKEKSIGSDINTSCTMLSNRLEVPFLQNINFLAGWANSPPLKKLMYPSRHVYLLACFCVLGVWLCDVWVVCCVWCVCVFCLWFVFCVVWCVVCVGVWGGFLLGGWLGV